MNQVNANLILAPTRLNRPLPTLYAKQLRSFVVALSNIPDDVTSVVIRVFKLNRAAFFDVPCGRKPDGTAVCYIIGTCFPAAGSSDYEVSGFDAKGNPTALGGGYVLIEPFSASGYPIDPGVPVVLDTIKDANGNGHTIKAVSDGEGGYTTIIDG